MINKMYAIIGIIGVVLVILFFVYKEGESKGKIKEIKKNQEIEININHEVIKEKKEIIKRKQIDRNVDTNTNLAWLHSNRCKDCKGR